MSCYPAFRILDLFILHGIVKSNVRRLKINFLNKLRCLFCTNFPVHSGVFPFDRQGACITNVIECPDDIFKMDLSPAQAPEIPVAPVVTKFCMAAENANARLFVAPVNIFHVYMENAVGKFIDEFYVVHMLVSKMTGVIIKSESRMVIQ